MTTPNTPIGSSRTVIIPDGDQDVASQSLHARLFASQCSGAGAQNLSSVVTDIGGGNAMALAAMAGKYDLYSKAADLNTFGGGGLGAGTVRASAFLQALKNYDDALTLYESHRNHRAAPATLAPLKAKATEAFKVLQTEFDRETRAFLQRHTAGTTHATISSASRSRVVAQSIPLRDAGSVQSLAKFARYGKGLGYGLIGLDGYLRYKQVDQLRQIGGNWRREAWAQGVGFAVGVAVGAFSFAILISPFGLVLGLIAAGVMAVAMDKLAVRTGGAVYDWTH